MQVDKQQIIDMLMKMGEHDEADKAKTELPDQVDTDQHADKLNELGIDPSSLASGGLGGIAGKIGL